MGNPLKQINIATIGVIDYTPSALDQGREGRKGEEAMNDMTDEQAIQQLSDMEMCGQTPPLRITLNAKDIQAIRRAIAALTAKSDAELIAWALTADLNEDGLTLGWCNYAKAWRLTTLMANESESEQERLKGNVRYRYLGSKKRPDLNAEDGPEARAILEAAKREADGKGNSNAD